MEPASPQADTWTVVAERLMPDAFAPFGEVVAAAGRDPLGYDLYDGRDENFVAGRLESDHPVELLLVRSRFDEFRVRYLERHASIAQAFLPLGGNPVLCVVARPEAELSSGLPALDELRAFVVGGNEGVVLKRGTWHEPPFALTHGATTLVSSHAPLTEALGSQRDEAGELHHPDVEKLNVTRRSGFDVRLSLP